MHCIPSKRDELVNALIENRASSTSTVPPVVSRPIAGPVNQIRISRFAENLKDIQEQQSEAVSKLGDIPEMLTQPPVRIVSRIMHSQ